MSQDWLNREFEKAAKETASFPQWMQDAIRNESMKSGQAVEGSRPEIAAPSDNSRDNRDGERADIVRR